MARIAFLAIITLNTVCSALLNTLLIQLEFVDLAWVSAIIVTSLVKAGATKILVV